MRVYLNVPMKECVDLDTHDPVSTLQYYTLHQVSIPKHHLYGRLGYLADDLAADLGLSEKVSNVIGRGC